MPRVWMPMGVLAAAALAVPAPAQAVFPGGNGLIAVVAGDQPPRVRPEIVLLRADGTVVRRIANPAPFGDLWPAWSPDGRVLAFNAAISAAEMRIALVRADGTHRRTLRRPAPGVDAVAPAWSPGGTRIAFGATGFDVSGIWTVDRQGRHVHRLSSFGQLPAWSTRGTIAVGDGGLGIWTMNRDGTGRRQVAGRGSDDPDWSPHGSRIAYTRTVRGVEQVWTMTSRGCDRRRLARGSMPAWSPDGRRIAFVRGGRLYVVSARGGSARRISYTPTTAAGRPVRLQLPAWQPVPRRATPAPAATRRAGSS